MERPAPIVHVVDDDDSLRAALMRLLRAAGYEVQGYPTAGEYLLARTAGAPGCVILDVELPGPNGLDVQDSLNRLSDPPAIVFLSGESDIPMSVRAMKAGAVDFLTKPVQREQLLSAVENALARDAENRSHRQQQNVLRDRFESLTPRERSVFTLVVAGNLNKQVAAELGTSERTVKAQRAQVMQKFQAESLADLVRAADQLQVDGSAPDATATSKPCVIPSPRKVERD
jgi:FixJ family two-component response regulator